MAYPSLLGKSFVTMELFSEGDLADTFIPAIPPTARWPSPSLIFPFQELQYLHIHVAFAPRFADQPLKVMRIDTDSASEAGQVVMVEVGQHWQGIVFPHVEYLETDRWYKEMDEIPREFWREFLLNVKKCEVVLGPGPCILLLNELVNLIQP
jgi:hypothetical protein